VKKLECTTLGLMLGLAGWTCSAQSIYVPFEQIEHDAQLQTSMIADAGDSHSLSPETLTSSYASGFISSHSIPAATHPLLNQTYFLLNGLNLGMALADVGLTQHCIADHRCKEGNPMMPSSQAGQIGISVGLFAYGAGTSYWLKKHKSKVWWTPPAVGVVSHIIGVASGLRFH
jgi:hypothetical protein